LDPVDTSWDLCWGQSSSDGRHVIPEATGGSSFPSIDTGLDFRGASLASAVKPPPVVQKSFTGIAVVSPVLGDVVDQDLAVVGNGFCRYEPGLAFVIAFSLDLKRCIWSAGMIGAADDVVYDYLYFPDPFRIKLETVPGASIYKLLILCSCCIWSVSDELNGRGHHICIRCGSILGATVQSEYLEMETC
jgi:hypothetical protein